MAESGGLGTGGPAMRLKTADGTELVINDHWTARMWMVTAAFHESFSLKVLLVVFVLCIIGHCLRNRGLDGDEAPALQAHALRALKRD